MEFSEVVDNYLELKISPGEFHVLNMSILTARGKWTGSRLIPYHPCSYEELVELGRFVSQWDDTNDDKYLPAKAEAGPFRVEFLRMTGEHRIVRINRASAQLFSNVVLIARGSLGPGEASVLFSSSDEEVRLLKGHLRVAARNFERLSLEIAKELGFERGLSDRLVVEVERETRIRRDVIDEQEIRQIAREIEDGTRGQTFDY